MSRRTQLVAVVMAGWTAACGRGREDEPTDKAGELATAHPTKPALVDAPPPPPPPPPPIEWYRGVVGTGAEEVPFFVSMPTPGATGSCVIVNGAEHIDVDCSWIDRSTILLEFKLFGTTLRATRAPDGALSGAWQLSRIAGAKPATFAGTRIAGPDPTRRFPAPAPSPTPAADFSGVWKFKFAKFDAGKGTFAQTPDGVVTGTIIPETIGDLRYLAGNVSGNALAVSTFDGQHAYVVRAQLDPGGHSIRGTWTFTKVMTDKFVAQRVDSLDIAIVEKLRLRAGATTVTIPQLDDPRYRGKPVIVDYFGTWCPACMDATPFLLDLYHRHHAEGLEILSIALEGTTDDTYNQQQVERFRKKYAIPWQIVVVAGDYSETQGSLPAELENTGGYPIAIFLDRARHVRGLHSGFFGPAAGDDYRQLLELFERYAREITAPAALPTDHDLPAPR